MKIKQYIICRDDVAIKEIGGFDRVLGVSSMNNYQIAIFIAVSPQMAGVKSLKFHAISTEEEYSENEVANFIGSVRHTDGEFSHVFCNEFFREDIFTRQNEGLRVGQYLGRYEEKVD